MEHSRLAKRVWVLFTLAVAFLYLYGLGNLPLVGPDEPRYAQVAREMFMRGDTVTPTLGGHTWFEKPALLYWLMMAGYSMFGVSEWTARAGAGLFAVLTVLIVGWLGVRVESAAGDESLSRFGLLSAAALASCTSLIVFGRAASHDIIVTMPIAAACAFFFVAEIEEDARRRTIWHAGFYAAMGVALLAKGLIGAVLPCGIVAIYFLLRRAWPSRAFLRSLWWGWLLTFAVASLWYAPVIWRHGWSFVDEFFIQHHLARYVSNKYRHPQPFYFYVPVMAMMALPWTCFLAAAVWSARRWAWRGRDAKSKARVFALAWMIVPVIFFSLSGSKLPGYILPALPGAALLVGERLAAFINRETDGRAWMRATGASILMLVAAGVVYAVMMNAWQIPVVQITLAVVFLAGAFALVKPDLRRASIAMIVGAFFALILLLAHMVAAPFARAHSARDLLQTAGERGFPSAPIMHFHTIERTSEFYAAERILYDAQGEPVMFDDVCELDRDVRRVGGTVLVFSSNEYLAELTEYPFLQTEILGANSEVTLVAVRSLGARASLPAASAGRE